MTSRPLPLLLRMLAVVGAAGALVLGAASSPAAAHDGAAIIDIEGVHPAGTSIHYVVRVTWEDDGHAAVGATVTATATNAAGTQLTPVTLAPIDEDGRYGGVLDYPSEGSWTVRVTSIDPTGSEEQAQEVTASATPEAPEDGPAEGDEGADDATGGVADGFAPADDGTGPDAEQAASDGSDDGGIPVYLIVAAAVVALVGAATAVGIVRRRSGAGPAGAAGAAGPDGPVDDTPLAEGVAGASATDDPPTSPAGTRPPAES
jgi:hypothetical protein